MGRSIEFRGINIADGLWAYGGIDIQRDTPIIITHGARAFVDHKTVGQFTGLLDKNGNKIFEGDKLKCFGYEGVVGFDVDEPRFAITPDDCDESFALIRDDMHEFEIIGNIHEA